MDDENQAIREVVNLYFKGTHEGNEDLLKIAFHASAHISGNLQGQYCDWSLNEFIKRVTQEPTPAVKNAIYDKEILSIEYENNLAFAKARVVINGKIFIDYITLIKIHNHWKIRNKSFTA